VLAFLAFPAHWQHRLRTTNLGEGWFKILRLCLSRFPGCRNVEASEQILGRFLRAGEQTHRQRVHMTRSAPTRLSREWLDSAGFRIPLQSLPSRCI
jgi:transposase-like protein